MSEEKGKYKAGEEAAELAMQTVVNPKAMSLSEAHGLAKVFVKSGLFKDTREMSQAVVKILAGYELGVGPFTAMRGINIIQGQLAPNASLTASLIKRDPDYDYKVVSSTREECELEFFCCGESIGKAKWDMEDAELAGVARKDNWKKYPRAMLFARAMTEGARQHVPHIFMGGVYVPEELGQENAEVIDVDVVEKMDVIETKEVIASSLAAIKDGTFTGNDYLYLGDALGYEKGFVGEVKRKYETRDKKTKKTTTDFISAAKELIKKYQENHHETNS